MMDRNLPDVERQIATKQFKQDVKKHIDDIAMEVYYTGGNIDCMILFLKQRPFLQRLMLPY